VRRDFVQMPRGPTVLVWGRPTIQSDHGQSRRDSIVSLLPTVCCATGALFAATRSARGKIYRALIRDTSGGKDA
jgi:hypothetical protein